MEFAGSTANLVAGPKEDAGPPSTENPAMAEPKGRRTGDLAAVPPEAVIDGDTFLLQGKKIRLYGIDAPEKAQNCFVWDSIVPCGQIARHALMGFVAGSNVRCDPMYMDSNGRNVSRCWAGAFDLSAVMARTGLAVAYQGNLNGYAIQQDRAKAQRRGIWKGRFVLPWVWRAKHDR